MAKSGSWSSRSSGAARKPAAPSRTMQVGRKGGYLSDRSMNFSKNQSIEELTGGRIKKKS